MKRQMYHEDSNIVNFSSKILSSNKIDGKFQVKLEKSYFYPESGGQLKDEGTINGNRVTGLSVDEDENIIHTIEGDPGEKTGSCVIDSAVRYSHMRAHTGQHILSAVIFDLFKGNTVSFHMSEEYSTIDLDFCPDDEGAFTLIEKTVNDIIMSDAAVETFWINHSQTGDYNFRKTSSHEGEIRVVRIDRVDTSMCAGTHVSSVGRIGMLMITGREKVKGGLLRIQFRCGAQAVDYANRSNRLIRGMRSLFSVPEIEVLHAAQESVRLKNECTRKNRRLNSRIAKLTAREAFNEEHSAVFYDVDFTDPETALYTAREIMALGAEKTAVYCPEIMTLILCSSDGNAAEKAGKALREKYGAKGGGRGDLFRLTGIKLTEGAGSLKGLL